MEEDGDVDMEESDEEEERQIKVVKNYVRPDVRARAAEAATK
jgi:hypothetical protein